IALNQTSKRIKDELRLNNERYGWVEFAFGISFAGGALLAGWAVDRWSPRVIYPVALLGWSLAGFSTGFARDFVGLLACRSLLGLFEAGNWPSALRTTQRILLPHERTLGNSILQSGAAVGAILTPLVVVLFVDGPALRWAADTWPVLTPWLGESLTSEVGRWRFPFFVIGAVGSLWVILWRARARRGHPPPPRLPPP